ncbi:hypothetical protein N7495_008901 [Penicillium taxi]|uniref:uncharacterized protein n=1 Tax=Penicillium taxi TaxID=168475 RepID=UPI002544E762|nr:uncharacterized protein N7495_008901 [Penicillium taxi]KAJ5888860.1 hypothetical protein N7495_008901 [Penicillium taxi]
MSKRAIDDDDDTGEQSDLPIAKRKEIGLVQLDRLSTLSNELILNILSFLPMPSLITCQVLSHRFNDLCKDSEIWKMHYFNTWVRPRACQTARVESSSLQPKTNYSPQVSTWLDHGHLATEMTNWKSQYRLRQNWYRGVCRVSEIEFSEPPSRRALVQLCAGIVVVADTHGLQVWAANDPARCLARISFSEESKILFHPELKTTLKPTALAVGNFEEQQMIVVGFGNGQVSRYVLHIQTHRLCLQSSHRERKAAITSVALSWPFLMMNFDFKLSLYRLRAPDEKEIDWHQVATLQSGKGIGSLNLSLFTSALDIVARIVYNFYHNGCGWALKIQELRFNKEGHQTRSRLTDTVHSQYSIHPLRGTQIPSIIHPKPPTSISYSHPYLLTSHSDNTLTMYLVVSDANSLFIGEGQRLWGHTSSVSTVQVTNRGKAVSMSSRGKEIRVWELEPTARQPFQNDSIQIIPDEKPFDSQLPDGAGIDEDLVQLECVGFDEERVLIRREGIMGTQLACYDFT